MLRPRSTGAFRVAAAVIFGTLSLCTSVASTLLQAPPRLTIMLGTITDNTAAVGACISAAVLALVLAWAVTLRHKVRRQTAALREERNLLATLIDHLPDHVYVKNTSGQYLLTNKAHDQFHGKTAVEFHGKSPADVFPADIAGVYTDSDREVLERHSEFFQAEEPARNTGGELRCLQTTKVPLRQADGSLAGLVGISRDITDTRRSEKALATLMGNLPGMAYRRRNDSQWTTEFLSEGCFELTGHKPADLLLNNKLAYIELIHPDDLPRVIQDISAALLDNRKYQVIYRIRAASGDLKWVWEQGMGVQAANGRFVLLEGFVADITERKLAEQRLDAFSALGQRLNSARDAKAAARIIVEVADQLIGWDSCSCNLYCAETGLITHVLSLDILNGERAECPPAYNLKPPSAILRRVIEEGGVLLLREGPEDARDNLRPFGDTARRSSSLLFVPIRNARNIIGVLSVQSYELNAYDWRSLETLQALADQCGGALERIGAEEALRESERFVRSLVENLPLNILRKDLEGRIIFVNDFFCRSIGRNAKELLGKNDFQLFPSKLAHKFKLEDQQILKTRQLLTSVEEVRGSRGEQTWVEIIKKPLCDEENRVTGLQMVFWDVTPRKQAEAELQSLNQKLLETSRQAGMAEVATGVLHNVGNVLNSVNVSATLVAERIQGSRMGNLSKVAAVLTEHGKDLPSFFARDARAAQIPAYLRQLSEHLLQERDFLLKELAALTDNIGHIKTIVTMQQSYAKVAGVVETVSPSELVEDAIRINGSALVRHRIQVVREFDAQAPPITVDKHKVLQVLINLIRNAKYACDETNQEGRRITLRICAAEKKVKIAVADNGIGIAPENLKRIFNLGFTTRAEGHGFGLHSGAIAAKELGGQLAAESEGVGRGAVFTLHLPINPPTATCPEPIATGQSSSTIAEVRPHAGMLEEAL